MTQTSEAGNDRPALVIASAIAVMIAFALLTVFMMGRASSDDETKWTRRVYIYGGVEAIVFAAAGALFGTGVQRAQVAKAEKREENAQRSAEANAAAATIAKALEAELRAWRSGVEDAESGLPRSGLSTKRIGAPTEAQPSDENAITADDLAGHLLRVIDNLR